MSRFLEDALQIFEAAASAPRESAFREFAILLDGAGGLRMVDAAGWAPEALRQHYGARTLYQVAHTAGGVRVTGCSEAGWCTLASERPRALVSSVVPHRFISPRLLSGGLEPGPGGSQAEGLAHPEQIPGGKADGRSDMYNGYV